MNLLWHHIHHSFPKKIWNVGKFYGEKSWKSWKNPEYATFSFGNLIEVMSHWSFIQIPWLTHLGGVSSCHPLNVVGPNQQAKTPEILHKEMGDELARRSNRLSWLFLPMITNGFDSDSTDNTYMIAMTMMKALVLMMIMTPYNCVKGNNDSKKKQ